MGAHIFTGAEAKALRDAIRHGGEPCPPDCSGECVAAYAGALMRLRDAAPDLAESVVHHAARAERAEAEAVSLRSSVTYLERQVDHEGAAQQATWRTLGGEGSAPNADAVTERATAVVGERAAALAHVEELTRALTEARRQIDVACVERDHAADCARQARTELDACRAIVEGRTEPPTDAEIAVHAARGGRWRTTYHVGDPALCGDLLDADAAERLAEGQRARPLHAYTWWATEACGELCLWPVATEAPRG